MDPLGLCKAELPSGSNTIKRADGSELITIPENARIRKLTPPDGYVGDYGYEYKWTNAGGSTTTVRIHGIDPTAPAGSNASQGWVVRIMDGKKVWMLMEIITLLVFLMKVARIITHRQLMMFIFRLRNQQLFRELINVLKK
ncbi:TPA: hypothetical protein L0W43_004623 [Escherichia coli]|nr:hypothetical protein [Escherichia coli]